MSQMAYLNYSYAVGFAYAQSITDNECRFLEK